MKGKDIFPQLRDRCEQILLQYADAVGFIGIARSPSCGISVGVKNRGSTMKAPMHASAPFPYHRGKLTKNSPRARTISTQNREV